MKGNQKDILSEVKLQNWWFFLINGGKHRVRKIFHDFFLFHRKTEKEYVFAEILDDVNDLNETEDFAIEDNKLGSIKKAGVKVEESKKIRKTATKRLLIILLKIVIFYYFLTK